MASAVLTSLSLVFMAAGATLWLTSFGLAKRARRYQEGMHHLLQLASQDLEPLDIPQAAWPALQQAGWQTLSWEGDWYGHPVSHVLGVPIATGARGAAGQVHELRSREEVYVRLHLVHAVQGGEQRLFANQLAQVFLLLLETKLRERTGALSAALAERARLSLYLQHDMRNMAQWVSWVSADFSSAKDSQSLLLAARRLQDNAPLAQERALRLSNALGNAPHEDSPSSLELRQALEQAARLAGVELQITGDANAYLAPSALARALDNLFSNVATNWREGRASSPRAHVENSASAIAHSLVARVTLWCPLPENGMALAQDKLFEPFASGRPGGLGLGLYQARQSLREGGGDLLASIVEGELRFEMHMPSKPNPP
jgi:signal transduction histidine kinase